MTGVPGRVRKGKGTRRDVGEKPCIDRGEG